MNGTRAVKNLSSGFHLPGIISFGECFWQIFQLQTAWSSNFAHYQISSYNCWLSRAGFQHNPAAGPGTSGGACTTLERYLLSPSGNHAEIYLHQWFLEKHIFHWALILLRNGRQLPFRLELVYWSHFEWIATMTFSLRLWGLAGYQSRSSVAGVSSPGEPAFA